MLVEWRPTAVQLGGTSRGPGVVRWAIVGSINQEQAEQAVERALLHTGSPCGLSYPHTVRYFRTGIPPETTVGHYLSVPTVGAPVRPGSPDAATLRQTIQEALQGLFQLTDTPGGDEALRQMFVYSQQTAPQGPATKILRALIDRRRETPTPSAARASNVVEWLAGILRTAYDSPDARVEEVLRSRLAEGPPFTGIGRVALGGGEWGSAIVAVTQDRRYHPADLRALAARAREIWQELKGGRSVSGPTVGAPAAHAAGILPVDEEPDVPF